MIEEDGVKIKVETRKIVSKDMPVFYNKDMKLNRDLTIYFLKAIDFKGKIGLPLAGSGIRALRIAKDFECDILCNDKRNNFEKVMEDNQKLNDLKVQVYNEDANIFMLKNKPFEFIDIDPFGTPNPFLDSAIQSLKSKSYLAVTATDTGALCGSYPSACLRKYWAKPLRNHEMHEIGLRILIRKIQLVGSQHDMALTPVYCISHLHYMKVFFEVKKGRKICDSLLKRHGLYKESGPMWLGNLFNKELALAISDMSENKLLELVKVESQVDRVGFYDVHQIAKKNKIKSIPKMEEILAKSNGTRTHFTPTGVKTNMKEKEFEELIRRLSLHQ